jgi:hypothetical protein
VYPKWSWRGSRGGGAKRASGASTQGLVVMPSG